MQVIIGATPESKKELVGVIDGVRECAQSRRELLLDLKRRGLAIAPEFAVADGALGFWQATKEVWPKTAASAAGYKTANPPPHDALNRVLSNKTAPAMIFKLARGRRENSVAWMVTTSCPKSCSV
jgi:hypothetical protein